METGARDSLRAPPPLFSYLVWKLPQPWKPMQALARNTQSENSNKKRALHVLCTSCSSAFSKSRLINGSWFGLVWPVEYHQLHSSLTDFADAVNNGCHFCTIAAAKMFPSGLPMSAGDVPSRIGIRVSQPDGRLVIEGTYNDQVPWDPSQAGHRYQLGDWCFYVHDTQEQYRGPVPQPDIAQEFCYTGSMEHLRLAKYWLEECSDKHTCCRLTDAPTLPTRLIHVGTDQTLIRLHETRQTEQAIRYCALTHCWGGATDILKLLTSNYDQLRARINLEDLPKTFRDAVFIARGVGIDYLWIDSLCIVQDSEEDWQKEAVTMGQVYEHASLTIAATKAKSAHDGCFSFMNPLLHNPCRIAGSDQRGLWVHGLSSDVLGMHTICRRAWTLQERWLSRRILHFGPDGIKWICGAGYADPVSSRGSGDGEVGDDILRDSVEIFGPTVTEHTRRKNQCQIRGKDAFVKILDMKSWQKDEEAKMHFFNNWWGQIVWEYTIAQLTRPEDKLIVISGIVGRVQQRTGLTYLCGLWKETLVLDLCWLRSGNDTLPARPASYRAPTWSWASVDGKVSLNYHKSSYDARVDYLAILKDVSVVQTNSSNDQPGLVLPGTCLTLTSGVLRTKIDLTKRDRHGIWPHAVIHPDVPLDVKNHSWVYLMPLVLSSTQDWNSQRPDPFKQSLRGIVLSLVANVEGSPVYERVGSFHLHCNKRYRHAKERFETINFLVTLRRNDVTII